MQVELIAATSEQEPILSNLLELYLHDFSEFHPLDVGPDGKFGYVNLPLYWNNPDRHAFLVQVDGKLAGVALVKRVPDAGGHQSTWDMAEFFILRGWRRNGIGTRSAHEVWKRFPGPWQVRVMQSNKPALQFWAHAIQESTGKAADPTCIENDGQQWHIFSFECCLNREQNTEEQMK